MAGGAYVISREVTHPLLTEISDVSKQQPNFSTRKGIIMSRNRTSLLLLGNKTI